MQFYDVYNLTSGQFILRAALPSISLIYRWHRSAERRIEQSGIKPTDMHSQRHEPIRVVPVMDDWHPAPMTVPDWDEIARGAIERDLINWGASGPQSDCVYDEAYQLALKALVTAGLDPDEATKVAIQQARLVAQP